MTTQEIDELFSQALSGEYEDEEPWTAIEALRTAGTREVFNKAVDCCKSESALARARGADILGQLGKTWEHRENAFPEEVYAVLTRLLEHENDPIPIASAVAALGHLDNLLAVPVIASFSSHPDSFVRFDVAFALGCYPNDPVSVIHLLKLTGDVDKDVRDWATFGLGVQGDVDSTEIRDALTLRLNDPDEDVREEAMVGLGKRRDERVLPELLLALERPELKCRIAEASYLMLGLKREQESWNGAEYVAALRAKFAGNE